MGSLFKLNKEKHSKVYVCQGEEFAVMGETLEYLVEQVLSLWCTRLCGHSAYKINGLVGLIFYTVSTRMTNLFVDFLTLFWIFRVHET